MRTTLDIDEDVLLAAKELAIREKSTAGAVLSQLARTGLKGGSGSKKGTSRNGVPVFRARAGEVVTLEHVRRLMDEEGV